MNDENAAGKKTIEQLEENMAKIAGEDCRYENWKEKCLEYAARFSEFDSEKMMGSLIDDQWQLIQDDFMSREKYYDISDSPLEVLERCVDSYFTYPPPEILEVIANQFRRYMRAGGELSLEEAFFGDPHGKGTYAKRSLSKHRLYDRFDWFVTKKVLGKDMTQTQIFEAISASKKKVVTVKGRTLNTGEYANLDADTFLRGYRRWRKNKDS